MTFEETFRVLGAVNLQRIINEQIESTGSAEFTYVDMLDDLINTFTPEQDNLFVSKMMGK